ncbi:MAG TPA: penicillin acylase family protein [Terriglobales bacterium]|jgi:penicillin amidase|nr:penicillin acylase family protein [Terriglobales bacterium]
MRQCGKSMSSTTVTPASPKTGQRSASRIAFRSLCALLLLFVALVAGFYLFATATLPQVDGTITAAGLGAPVEVLRDAQGVPHIRAQNLPDMLFAQGYVTAQDRLWQMDMTRRYAGGELSEILGPELVEHDRAQRILSLRSEAQRSSSRLDDHEKALFEAYARGVNAFIDSHKNKLPLEFRLMGYSPRPWTVEDSFIVGAQMAQNLSHEQFATKLLREKLTAILGAQKAADLYTNTSWRDRPPGEAAMKQEPPAHADPDDEDSGGDTNVAVVRSTRHSALSIQPEEVHQPSTSLRTGYDTETQRRTKFQVSSFEFREKSSQHPALSIQPERVHQPSTSLRTGYDDEDGLIPGSNNWVVSGEHTITGKPMLSNDMHLHHQIPGVWYEAQLTAGAFDAAGVTLPGFPFVIAGHNRRIAWGFTNLNPDVEDIFIENFNGRGEYQTAAGWKQPERRREVIHVKGEPDVVFDVLLTRHGPIVTELMPGETRKIALQWTLYTADLGAPFGALNQAQNWNEFRNALRNFTIPGQNVVYADVDGHIGYQSTGEVPLRRSGNGALPVSGADDAHEWTGYIPFDQMPSVYDPPGGVLATANGRITAARYPYSISTQWGAPYRTQRIYRVLESGNKFSSADMLALQNDIYSDFDKFCAEQFVAAVDHSQIASARAKAAAEIMRSWDGRLTIDSAAATITIKSENEFQKLLLGSYWHDYVWPNSAVAWENLLTRRPKYWLPAGFNNYDALLTEAVEKVVAEYDAPTNLAAWGKGRAYPLEIAHPVFDKIPILRWFGEPGRVKQSGGSWTVKQVGRSFGPSERMTVDLGNLDQSTLNVVTGESGQIFSRHYMDQWKAWYEGQTFLLPFSQGAVESAGKHRLRLEPK